jgi:hypothetical protein
MNTQQVIGDFFEDLLSRMFGLKRIDRNFSHKEPDLRGETFDVEVKSSRFDNGGVIKRRQLKYIKNRPRDCPYAFPNHELKTPIWKYYQSERSLRRALNLKSLYILPLSVVKARYETGYRRPYPTDDDFVQIRESLAASIFSGNGYVWKTLHLDFEKYIKAQPKGTNNIFIMSDNKATLDKLLSGFSLDVYLSAKK